METEIPYILLFLNRNRNSQNSPKIIHPMTNVSCRVHLTKCQHKSDAQLNNGEIAKQTVRRSGPFISEASSDQELQANQNRVKNSLGFAVLLGNPLDTLVPFIFTRV